LVQTQIWLITFKVSKVADKHWNSIEISVSIFDVEFEESVCIFGDVGGTTGKTDKFKIASILSDNAESFHVDH